MSIKTQIEKSGDWEKLTLMGPINEDAEVHFPALVQKLGKNVVINFKEVSNVNSCGVRAWITFLRDLEKGRSLIFEECTPEIISQINMIPNFRGKSEIHSAYGGYTCPSCGHSQLHLFAKGKNMPASASDGAGDIMCAKCGKPTEMDEIEEEFFAWIDG